MHRARVRRAVAVKSPSFQSRRTAKRRSPAVPEMIRTSQDSREADRSSGVCGSDIKEGRGSLYLTFTPATQAQVFVGHRRYPCNAIVPVGPLGWVRTGIIPPGWNDVGL